MQILNKFKNPLIFIVGWAIKKLIKYFFFRKINNDDFNSLIYYTLIWLPSETIINIFILLTSLIKTNSSEVLTFGLINNIVQHTLTSKDREELTSKQNLKYFFILTILWDLLKRNFILFKTIILFPFKIGVYSFIGFLFGIKPDFLLSLFDYFKFNLPSWTYSKLIDLHLSWLTGIKNILQINSISIDGHNSETEYQLPKRIIKDLPIESEEKEDKYLYLTKKQWIYLSLTAIVALGTYLGFTFGVPFNKSFEWVSKDNSTDSDNGENGGETLKGKRGIYNFPINPRGVEINDKTWQDTFTELGGKLIKIIKKPFNWFKSNPYNLGGDEIDDIITKDKAMFDYWKNSEEVEFEVRKGMLRKLGQLSEEEREELIKDYKENKNTSPTPSDPETVKDLDQLFPYKEQDKPLVSIKKNTNSNLYSLGSDSNDSTETIKPIKNKDNIEEIFNPFNPEGEGLTYPPDQRRSKFNFSDLADTPFAYGYSDEIVFPPHPSDTTPKRLKITRGSVMMSARILDQMKNDWED